MEESIRPVTFLWVFVGVVLILVGLQGDLGALLASFLAPDALVDTRNG